MVAAAACATSSASRRRSRRSSTSSWERRLSSCCMPSYWNFSVVTSAKVLPLTPPLLPRLSSISPNLPSVRASRLPKEAKSESTRSTSAARKRKVSSMLALSEDSPADVLGGVALSASTAASSRATAAAEAPWASALEVRCSRSWRSSPSAASTPRASACPCTISEMASCASDRSRPRPRMLSWTSRCSSASAALRSERSASSSRSTWLRTDAAKSPICPPAGLPNIPAAATGIRAGVPAFSSTVGAAAAAVSAIEWHEEGGRGEAMRMGGSLQGSPHSRRAS
mmetsp:Transcript_110213/g.351269  ORF Transcript_110213/g.351269 Transcript_110213/m.351269 type:complete len:283 (+) Transcript_110213:1465-2313(+)